MRVQELSEVRYLQEVSVLVLFYLQLASTVVIDAVEVDFVLFDFLDLLKCFGLCDLVDHAELEMLNGRLVGLYAFDGFGCARLEVDLYGFLFGLDDDLLHLPQAFPALELE